MLQIKHIKKQYITGDLKQTALDDVSLTFREHELVAILGPSGSGKSTLLNVIGGLDHYDSGDLIINGISTKKYSDRDWDSYRNHSVGFIFQSYNLIPHQNVLSNVELALTISGVPASQRKRRAMAALENVGLGAQIHKKPNQMSGGQMQRVAIARALVNNPKILLADEPTGALDSETSIQVMELLKEVAQDRLVIMVTHNPELAEQYASRIVRVKDGRILDDTDPYEPEIATSEPPKHKNMGRSSMSFRSALVLSFQNLWTKKARTLLTSFAGSIGIIGIALILSLSAGFQSYIDSIQRDTLASYPLTLQSETADMSSVFMTAMVPTAKQENQPPNTVAESPVLAKMFAHIGVNDLGSFKNHIEENWETVQPMVNSISYGYGIKPRIYTDNPEDPLQVNPASLFMRITGNEAFSAMMDSDAFQELTEDQEMLENQYEILCGRWPENYDELVFILPQGGQMPDSIAYTLGLKNMEILDHMLELMEDGQPMPEEEPMNWPYEELLNVRYRWVSAPSLYEYSEEFDLWEDLSKDPEYLSEAVRNGTELKVVGVIVPREGSTGIYYPGIGYLRDFTRKVIEDASESEIVKQQLADTEVDVFSGTHFNGEDDREFPSLESMISVDGNAISSAFGININESEFEALLEQCMAEVEAALSDIDTTGAKMDFVHTFKSLATRMLEEIVAENGGAAEIRSEDISPLVSRFMSGDYASAQIAGLSSDYQVSSDVFYPVYESLLGSMMANFLTQNLHFFTADNLSAEVPAQNSAHIVALSEVTYDDVSSGVEEDPPETFPEEDWESEPPQEEIPQEPEIPDPDSYIPPAEEEESYEENTDENYPEFFPEDSIPPVPGFPEGPGNPDPSATLTEENIDSVVYSFLANPMMGETAEIMGLKMMEATALESMADRLSGLDSELTRFLQNSFHVDGNRIKSAFQFNMDEEKLQRLFEALVGGKQARSAVNNLQKLGYADLDKPTYMGVYMKDFHGKEDFIQFLEDYNQEMEDAGKESQVIQYTDMTGQMMDSVRIIIDSVSYVLIAFVAVSLIVSSIMIGIITYISVMERTKEIGVLRAMGASKHNISQVFNAETFIIGLSSGILGILISLSLLIPGNMVLHKFTGNLQISAELPVVGAIVLVILSMLLTVIGGLIPSRQAAKKDPVTALRSE